MDDLDNSKGFLKHVFNFDDESKGDILNLLQYIFIALIPIVLLNKSMQKYVPELDERKGSIEITAEILIQIMVMFMGLFLIHRIITFVPTYSGIKYHDIRIIFTVLPVLSTSTSPAGENETAFPDGEPNSFNNRSVSGSIVIEYTAPLP